MLKNKKIGFKIATGLVVMIIILSVIIVYTIVNMRQQKQDSVEMKDEQLPIMTTALEFKDHIAAVMINMRTYALNGGESSYTTGLEELENANEHLNILKEYLEIHPDNETVKVYYDTANAAMESYKVSIQDLYNSVTTISSNRETISKASTVFVENANAYYEDQTALLKRQINANESVAVILDRQQKIEAITKVIDMENDANILVNEALYNSDAELLRTILPTLDEIDVVLDSIIQDTLQEKNLNELQTVKSSLTEYKETLNSMALAYDNRIVVGTKRNETGNQLQEIANSMTAEEVNNIVLASEHTLLSVDSSTNVLIYGFVIALLVGIIFNYVIIKNLTKSIGEVTLAAETLSQGDIDITLVPKGNDEIATMTRAFIKMIDNTKSQAMAVMKIAEGDRHVVITPQSEKDVLNINLGIAVDNLNELLKETDQLSSAVKRGDLSLRGNAGSLQGSWRDLIEGVNELINAFVDPIEMTNAYVSDLGNGIIPEKIEREFYGDFNITKESLNMCIDGIQGLVLDTNSLIEKAKEGNLSYRANEGQHLGNYKRIVQGFNETLDAVIQPIAEAATVLGKIAEGNLNIKVTGNYSGDHNLIKNALNDTIESLLKYIEEISYVLGKMSLGDFTVTTRIDFAGNFKEIEIAFEGILNSLNNVLNDINIAADQVSSGASQVSSSSQALSQGSTEQASSVEEITQAITEVAEQTRENAKNASKANELTEKAKNDAVNGNDKMNEMVEAMREINDSSNNISKIIKVIDEIAFQTNILALNAAVEAARAGEHGKGFAVVAEEVRNLAARSANAAKETTTLIENSINKVESGTDIANYTAKALSEIVGGVSTVANIVSTIANASSEQAIAISQINEGVNQISDVTQSNTSTAEETAASSEEMSAQADLLKDMISRFQIKEAVTGSSHLNKLVNKNVSEKSDSDQNFIHLDDNDFGKY